MISMLQEEVGFAVTMVRQAAQLARQVQAEMLGPGLTKGDLSPVTVADYVAQAVVAEALSRTFPEEGLVGEESSAPLQTPEGVPMLEAVTRFAASALGPVTEEAVCAWIDRGTADPGDRFWTLDPVDGTKGFLRGGQYAVALALIEDGIVRLGALACPHLGMDGLPGDSGTILVARFLEGAYVTALDEDTPFVPVRVSGITDITQARVLRSFEAGHTNADEIDAICERLGIRAEPVLMDSQAKYAAMALDRGELLFRLLSPKQPDYREKIWDQAAGSLILNEAGGRITDLRGADLDFSCGRRLEKNTGVFASNGPLHKTGLEAIAAVCGLDA